MFDTERYVARERKLGRENVGRYLATCATCRRTWDDGVVTAYTPAPGGRCPFEDTHHARRPVRVIRPAGQPQVEAVQIAIDALKQARDALKLADCPQTLTRVRAALTSADGALRHVQTRANRTQETKL